VTLVQEENMILEHAAMEREIEDTVDILCDEESYSGLSQARLMPSLEVLSEVMRLLRSVLFPGYFGPQDLSAPMMRHHMTLSMSNVYRLMRDQVKRGYCFTCTAEPGDRCEQCEREAADISAHFVARIPAVRDLLKSDVTAAYEGDPAAKSPGETIFCYPSVRAVTNYRVAHALYVLGAPLIPRILTEMAHSETGIDIHPGAEIGTRFFIDHGTGVVIGETSVIGSNVRLYQGVTLGAKSFPLDEHGNPIKNIPRHPIVEDDVIIYSGATVLGRITIGRGSVIGGNVWLTHDVPPGTRLFHDGENDSEDLRGL